MLCVFKEVLSQMYLTWTIHLETFGILVSSQMSHLHMGMVFRGPSSPGQVKTHLCELATAMAQEKHKGMPPFTVWGAPPKK